MTKFGKSQTIKRREDLRFLTGRGAYVDDIAPAGAAVALFLRSPHGHADLRAVDVAAARDMPGVLAVLTADDLIAAGVDINMRAFRVTMADGRRGAGPDRPVLARGRVRFVGEPVAVVVADTLDAARDAAEAVEVDYAERPAHVDLAPGGPQLHDEAPRNIAFDWSLGDAAATGAAFAGATRRAAIRVVHNRVIANSLEPRGAWAEWTDGHLHVAVNGQGSGPRERRSPPPSACPRTRSA
jgi:aerobic carbon-monoxide dehydrogenase large subunit